MDIEEHYGERWMGTKHTDQSSVILCRTWKRVGTRRNKLDLVTDSGNSTRVMER